MKPPVKREWVRVTDRRYDLIAGNRILATIDVYRPEGNGGRAIWTVRGEAMGHPSLLDAKISAEARI